MTITVTTTKTTTTRRFLSTQGSGEHMDGGFNGATSGLTGVGSVFIGQEPTQLLSDTHKHTQAHTQTDTHAHKHGHTHTKAPCCFGALCSQSR